MSVKKINIGPAKRKAIDRLVREAAGTKRAIEAKLDCRYTSKEGVYGAYERYLLSDGRVPLDKSGVFLSGRAVSSRNNRQYLRIQPSYSASEDAFVGVAGAGYGGD